MEAYCQLALGGGGIKIKTVRKNFLSWYKSFYFKDEDTELFL